MSQHWASVLAAADLKFSSLHRKRKEARDGKERSGSRMHDVRELTLSIMGKEMTLRRVYIDAVDSGGLRDVGWIVNQGVYFCLVCSVPFDAVTWKHHCRACGLVTCNSCTSRLVRIEGFEHYGKQRVCKHCNPHQERRVTLMPDTEWGNSIADTLLETSPGKPVPVLHDPDSFQVSNKPELLVFDLWKHGPVQARQVLPKFVLLASRKDRRLFVNVCTCEYVPLSASPAALTLLVGAAGTTAEGITVYDVAVNDRLFISADDGNMRKISRQVLAGLTALNLERSYSIINILPGEYTYQERKMTATEQDAAELDQISLASTVQAVDEGASTVRATVEPAQQDWLVALVVPAPAAFARYGQICTTRGDLEKNPKYSITDWKKYGHITIDASGLLSCDVAGSISFGRRLSSVDNNRQSARRFSTARRSFTDRRSVAVLQQPLTLAERVPELRVCIDRDGTGATVRGVLHLPATARYVIEAPRRAPAKSADKGATTPATAVASPATTGSAKSTASQQEGATGGGSQSGARIHVIQHPVVDYLYALGAVATSDFSDFPVLVCEKPDTHVIASGDLRVVYHVAVQASYMTEVEGTVGSAFENRIKQVIGKVNAQFAEEISEAQFLVRPIPAAGSDSARAGKQQSPLDPAVENIALLLYEHDHVSAAHATAALIAEASRGGLPLTPPSPSPPSRTVDLERYPSKGRRVSGEAPAQASGVSAVLKRGWPVALKSVAEASAGQGQEQRSGKKAWK